MQRWYMRNTSTTSIMKAIEKYRAVLEILSIRASTPVRPYVYGVTDDDGIAAAATAAWDPSSRVTCPETWVGIMAGIMDEAARRTAAIF